MWKTILRTNKKKKLVDRKCRGQKCQRNICEEKQCESIFKKEEYSEIKVFWNKKNKTKHLKLKRCEDKFEDVI